MFKKYIFAIFLNLFLLTVSQSQITPNRFDLLLETLTRPISGYVEGFKNEMSRNAKIYLNLSYPDEDIDDPQNTSIRQPKRNPPRHTVLVEDDEDVIDEGDIITEASSQRLLQGSICANGIQTTGNRTRYFYQGYEIGYDVALSLINGEPVTFYGETLFNISQVDAVVSPVTLCWCPLDYFGSRCQVQMPLLCEINQTIPQCPKIDPWLYSFNFTGDPPCLRVRKGNPFNFNARITCNYHPDFSDFVYEGVKRTNWFYTVNRPNNASISYIATNNNFKLSKNPEGILFSLDFINFLSLTDKRTFNANLTARQAAGIDAFTLRITLDKSFDRYYYVGNYYYEMSIINVLSRFSGVDKSYHYTITDSSYVEPGPQKRINVGLAIFLLLLIAFLAFSGWWHYRKYKADQKDKADKAAYENYVDDDNLLERPE